MCLDVLSREMHLISWEHSGLVSKHSDEGYHTFLKECELNLSLGSQAEATA